MEPEKRNGTKRNKGLSALIWCLSILMCALLVAFAVIGTGFLRVREVKAAISQPLVTEQPTTQAAATPGVSAVEGVGRVFLDGVAEGFAGDDVEAHEVAEAALLQDGGGRRVQPQAAGKPLPNEGVGDGARRLAGQQRDGRLVVIDTWDAEQAKQGDYGGAG